LIVPAVATVAGLPTKLGKYELLMPLAAGGMARIYIGRSTGIGSFERHVVLKLITPERERDATAVQMFLDEARLAASLNHQNVAQVFEVGEDLGIHYLAMEYVHGQDLRALLAKAGSQGTRIPLELALTVIAGAAAGLNHAHERRGADGVPLGIVHRDVSPSNLMIGYDGSVKLLDFGIAKATARSVQTQSGIIKGKFAYMAPEQCRGRDVDRRSDVFSLGIILYEITTQHRCFRADNDFDTMHRIVTGDVVRPTRLVQGYPPALEAIVMKALAVDAVHRYQSAGLLLEALESFAIASRFSLSTMGLGRFMRDMFGESQEPWLTAPQDLPIVAEKESTVSSTDGRSDVSASPLRAQDKSEAIRALAERLRDSDDSAAMTALDMRQDQDQDDDDLDCATEVHAGPSITDMLPQRSQNPTQPMTSPARLGSPQQLAKPPAVVVVPPASFQRTPGSQPSPTHPALPVDPQLPPTPGIASTRHGYASGAAVSQAGSPPPSELPPIEPTGDRASQMSLRPNHRLLAIGLGVLVLGIVIMIAMLAGGSTTKDNDGLEPGPERGSAVATGSDRGATAIPTPILDEYIQIHVVSQPIGADVLIAGSKVGVTPWNGKLKHSGAVTTLAVHLGGYSDYVAKIDLAAATYDNETVTLTKLLDTPKGPAVTTEQTVDPKPTTATPTHAPTVTHPSTTKVTQKIAPAVKLPRCQPPGQVNPFDDRCDGKPCPVCK
jgi:serine/threonine protein kinase